MVLWVEMRLNLCAKQYAQLFLGLAVVWADLSKLISKVARPGMPADPHGASRRREITTAKSMFRNPSLFALHNHGHGLKEGYVRYEVSNETGGMAWQRWQGRGKCMSCVRAAAT
jgi:hypothetical protein